MPISRMSKNVRFASPVHLAQRRPFEHCWTFANGHPAHGEDGGFQPLTPRKARNLCSGFPSSSGNVASGTGVYSADMLHENTRDKSYLEVRLWNEDLPDEHCDQRKGNQPDQRPREALDARTPLRLEPSLLFTGFSLAQRNFSENSPFW
jgi:hypothetical protein